MDEASAMAASPATSRAERRQVSVLFADMVGYTAIVERLGEEGALPFVRMVHEKLTSAVREQGGAVRGFAGDSIMAVFGIPDALEDGALRACRTALAIHAAFANAADDLEARFAVRPSMRTGVSTGIAVMAAVEGEGAALTAVGDTVNLASRLQALAPAGGCLICEATRRLVEWLVDMSFDGEHAIRGRTKPQKLWRVLSIREGATRFDVSLGRGLGPYVGRDAELSAMAAVLGKVGDGLGVIDLVAEPGLGKTRLVFEFLQRQNDATGVVLTGHCAADGQQTPFLPFLEVVRGAFRIRPEDEPAETVRKIEAGLVVSDLHSAENAALLLNLLGLASPEAALSGLDGVLIGLRTRDLLLALLKARCRTTTVVLLLEDVHWIDGASEALLDALVEDAGLSNLLILQTRRPEYSPGWLGDPRVCTLALQPLAAGDITLLARTRLGVDALPDALIRQVTERAGGNPLFGEEILGFLIDKGALRVEAGKVEFDAALGEGALPASMQGLLTARMDRLVPDDRALLQAAAVIGRRFDPGLLALVVDQADDTGAALRRLQAQDLVAREPNSSDYVFKHVLLRDSVYQSLLLGPRAALHRKIADAVAQRSGTQLAEAADTLAHHYARTDRKDLAFTYLAMAGAKSLGVFSLDEADLYFAEALALYEGDPACAGDDAFAECFANYALCLNLSLQVTKIAALAARFGAVLDRIGDNRHHVIFLHHQVSSLVWNGRYLDAIRVQEKLSAMAKRLGDQKSIAYAIVSDVASSIYAAPSTREIFEARRREAEAALADFDDAYLQYFYLANVGYDEVCRGRVIEARAAADRLTEIGRSTNEPRSLGYGTAMKALIAMLADDYELALEEAERAITVSRVPFEKAIATSTRHAVLLLLDRPGAVEEGRAYVAMCETNGWALFKVSPETMIAISLARTGRITDSLRLIETAIAQRENEGFRASADWYRLFVCEIYLAILLGEGGGSLAMVARNLRSIATVLLFGPGRILSLVEKVRANPQWDRAGYYFARTEIILGLLCKARKNPALAERHLAEARRILGAFGASPTLTRVDTELAALASRPGYAPSAAR